MHRHFALAAAGLALVAACKNSEAPAPPTPSHLVIVSGSDQTADLSAPLAAPLVVEVEDGRNVAVSGVAVAWTVRGGGTLSAATATTDSLGRASVTWTLGPTLGPQVVTAGITSGGGSSVSFVASNGPTITGTVTIANPDPTSFFSAQRSVVRSGARALAPAPAAGRVRVAAHGLEVRFRSDRFSVAQAGSPAYRSLAVARGTAAVLGQRLATITRGLPVRDTRVSPAILMAHLEVADTGDVAAVVAALRADPGVASVSHDVLVGVPQGAPPPQNAPAVGLRTSSEPVYRPTGAPRQVPNDPYYWVQEWGANMVDLPRAWAITTGSSAFTIAVVDQGVRFDAPSVAANFTNDGYDFVSPILFSDIGDPSNGAICGGGVLPDIDDDGTAGPDPDPTDPDGVIYDSTAACWQHATLGDHGLWTSGIVGAVSNDGNDVAGVDWNARIRPIRVLGITGLGTGFDIAQGILYAAGLPAVGAGGALVTAPSKSAIINLSLGGFGSDSAEAAAVQAAEQAGCLVVASAGNGTTDVPVYPAAYPGVVGVSAVGMDGVIASYSNGGSYVSLAAPGGEYRLDDNGGDGILGPGWNFQTGQPTFLVGYGTSAAAPYVSGVAALVLSHEPGLSAEALATRLETYASRRPNSGRNDSYGWGIVNAYNALMQRYDGPPHATYVRLVNALNGGVVRTVAADAFGSFTFTQLDPGTYWLQAGEDENGDMTIGIPGRRFAWAAPGTFTVARGQEVVQSAGITLGIPVESEPNDLPGGNPLAVGSYVVGQISGRDAADYYQVQIPTPGVYTFETSGVTGACGEGIELDTDLQLWDATGAFVGENDNNGRADGPYCSTITGSLNAGSYSIEVRPSTSGLADHGRYRLQVRPGN